MDFKNRELKFGFKEKQKFDAQAVIDALDTVGKFKGVELVEKP